MHASNVIRSTAPALEPVSVADLKQHLRIAHADDDGWLSALIAVARERLEDECLRAFISQSFVADLVGEFTTEAIELPRPRLIEVTGLTYRKSDGTWEAHTLPAVRLNREPSLIWLPDEPTDIDDLTDDDDAVYRVTFTAGYGTAEVDVPRPIRQAIIMMAASLYENRDDHIVGASTAPVPHTSERLIAPYKVEWRGNR